MKYTFTFKRISYGNVDIDADYEPTEDEVLDAIPEGAIYHCDADYVDICLACTDRAPTKQERRYRDERVFS